MASPETLRPSADGTTIEVQNPAYPANAHWSLVDEAVADDLTTYIEETNNLGFRTDTYTLPNLSEASGITITSVKVYFNFRSNTAAYTAKGKAAVRVAGTNYFGTEQNPSTSWTTYSEEWTVSPATSSAWTIAEVNALEAGVSLDRPFQGYATQCTQVYVVVAYLYTYDMPAGVGSFTLTGIDALFSKGYVLACTVGAFTLTGITTILTSARSMIASVGAFTLTGVTALLERGYTLVASVGSYILTGISVLLSGSGSWKTTNQSKSSAISPTNQSKNTISPTGQAKSSTVSFTNSEKS